MIEAPVRVMNNDYPNKENRLNTIYRKEKVRRQLLTYMGNTMFTSIKEIHTVNED